MEKMLDKSYLQHFLETHPMAVLSTVNKSNLPDAAPIYFIIRENFEIFFITTNQTQKYANLKSQKHIVLTVTDEKTKETMQIRGKAQEEKESVEKTFPELKKHIFSLRPSHPSLPLMEGKGQKTVFRVVVEEIRMRKYRESGLEEGTIQIS